ncbi:hypothetical protein DBA29_27120 [Xenophilus aerolatus]|nr:hypothetical protein [Xenophilus aerolatus]
MAQPADLTPYANPVESPAEPFNIADHFLTANAGRSDKLAFVDGRATLTHNQLDRRVRQTAAAIRDLGIKCEERVLIVLQDTVDWPTVLLGAVHAGVRPIRSKHPPNGRRHAYMLEHL